jgi:hypothetical protein
MQASMHDHIQVSWSRGGGGISMQNVHEHVDLHSFIHTDDSLIQHNDSQVSSSVGRTACIHSYTHMIH